MRQKEDHQTLPLFSEMFPFGGQIDDQNRWIRLSELIPWSEFEEEYSKSLSEGKGRPGHRPRLIIGLIILKHTLGVSDREIVHQLSENVYFQHFCGFDHFQVREQLDPSVLTYARRRMSRLKFEMFESHLVHRLMDLKLLVPKKQYVDATVIPSDIAYPNDAGLLEKGRRYLVKILKEEGKKIGKVFRTYTRKAKKIFLSFSKKKTKTKKIVRKAVKQGLQFVKRNLGQVQILMNTLKEKGQQLPDRVVEKIKLIQKVYDQQKEMYKTKTHQIADRIVSLWKAHVRPVKRGKAGKKTEFGAKVNLSYVDGFAFIDHLSFDNFNEGIQLKEQIFNFEHRFGKKPDWVAGDQIYANRENRSFLKEQSIRTAFKKMGRAVHTETPYQKQTRRKEQKNRGAKMEGIIGHLKQHFNCHRNPFKTQQTEILGIHLSNLAMNLQTALHKA